jgi:hypothetical protein
VHEKFSINRDGVKINLVTSVPEPEFESHWYEMIKLFMFGQNKMKHHKLEDNRIEKNICLLKLIVSLNL